MTNKNKSSLEQYTKGYEDLQPQQEKAVRDAKLKSNKATAAYDESRRGVLNQFRSSHSERKHMMNMKHNLKKAEKMRARDKKRFESLKKFGKYEQERKGKAESQMSRTLSGGAFAKLGDQGHVRAREAALTKIAKEGISGEQRAEERAKVGAAIAGQRRATGRRMQSILSGQGVRGAAPSRMMQNIADKGAKLRAGFDMSQMARSYADKTKAEDARAKMQADVATYDIGQDKAALEFKTGRETFQSQRRANLVNALAAKQIEGAAGVERIMASERFMES